MLLKAIELQSVRIAKLSGNTDGLVHEKLWFRLFKSLFHNLVEFHYIPLPEMCLLKMTCWITWQKKDLQSLNIWTVLYCLNEAQLLEKQAVVLYPFD